jgi:hypothetical protein
MTTYSDCAYTDLLLSQIGVVKKKVEIVVAEKAKEPEPFKPTYIGQEPPF